MRRVAVLITALGLAIAGMAPGALGGHGGPIDVERDLAGVPIEVRVPEHWNGTLLVYAHGYRDRADQPWEVDDRSVDAAPGGDPMEEVLLSLGYALAASAYENNGWAVKEGIRDTKLLTEMVVDTLDPDRVILWGFSMGSFVTFESAEQFAGLYDGFIPACAGGAGASDAWSGAVDAALAYHVAFGWPESWGTYDDVRDDLDFETEVVPVLLGQVLDPTNFGRFEFMRMVSGLPAADFYSGSNWLFTDMYFFTEARAELERRAGGPVGNNAGHVYSLTPAEIGYLAALGVDAGPLLDVMNATSFSGSERGNAYTERFADYTGVLEGPVLTLHTIGDGLVPVQHESAYRETVNAAGSGDLLVQTYTDAIGHCDFTGEQLVSVVLAMDYWLQTGVAPGPEFFPEALGFLPDYEPGPWPQP